MKTATQISEREYDEKLLQRRFEEFVRRWAPEDDRGRFNSELFMLVRAIHADAAKPYEHSMRKMMDAMPIMTLAPQVKP